MKERGDFDPPVRTKVEFNPKEFYLKHKDDIKNHYTFHELIGEGALSRVKRA